MANPKAERPNATSTVLGYPRIGPDRELKKATEAHWRGDLDAAALERVGATLRRQNWQLLRAAGIEEIPSNDFSFYDQVLDMITVLGAEPDRYRSAGTPLEQYFAMARGNDRLQPLEMTKWFNTNYHYLVPELGPDTSFALASRKPVAEFNEAKELGIHTRPVLIGPVTFLRLAKAAPGVPEDFDSLTLLDRLLPVYRELLGELAEAGADWVQVDEPIVVTDQPPAVLAAISRTYADLGTLQHRPKLVVATYFDVLGDALPLLAAAPVEGLAVDFTGPAAANVEALAAAGGLPGKRLYAGVVSGRNVWRNDLRQSLAQLATLHGLADEVVVSTSSSLLHVPVDLAAETDIDPRVASWLAFARQKVDEVVTLQRGLTDGVDTIAAELADNATALASRATSELTRNRVVRARTQAITDADAHRASPYADRVAPQGKRLGLPRLPTTTIGSFPQTAEIRKARRDWAKGDLDDAAYEARIRAEIEHVVELQHEVGLDVLVHGEAERNDMVQYFAEQLTGFVSTRTGWVQSYGSRYVRPPILFGDVARPEPMAVRWATYAQSLSERPVKGMLTGPVTILAWSFVRDDQPAAETARQVALALRDEVQDLQDAGIGVIQVDEPALRETLPLRRSAHAEYLRWAVEAFRLATAGVRDETQIHTHMCYAEFGEILDAVAALDADVISLEAARSRMQITHDLSASGYPAEVGPGVYDIHSPRVPSTEEIVAQLQRATAAMPVERVWVNPDCGLKTRREEEVRPALTNLVEAARIVRQQLPAE